MTDRIAFLGDIHGNLDALLGMEGALEQRGHLHLIFLGDFINKGPRSAEVVGRLLTMKRAGQATLLCGNHETALLQALDESNLTAFIKMGGAKTIRSYVGGPVGPDVLKDFRAHLPNQHLAGLRAMPTTWESDELLAQHTPSPPTDERFRVSAHVSVGPVPRITATTAQIDTGCGSGDGRLTAFLWPSRDYIQVSASGQQLPRNVEV